MDTPNPIDPNKQTPTVPNVSGVPPASVPQNPPTVPAKPAVEVKNTSVSGGKNNTGMFIVIAVIVFLVLLIGAAFWYLNYNQKQVSPQNPVTVNTNLSPTPAAQQSLTGQANDISVDNIDMSDIDTDLSQL